MPGTDFEELPPLVPFGDDGIIEFGQTIRLDGLLCLFDAEGPCGNAVKDCQRTKTDGGTRRTLSVIWGTSALPGRAAAAEHWYHTLLQAHEATVHPPRPR